jgi:hypothetical protein
VPNLAPKLKLFAPQNHPLKFLGLRLFATFKYLEQKIVISKDSYLRLLPIAIIQLIQAHLDLSITKDLALVHAHKFMMHDREYTRWCMKSKILDHVD